VSGLSGATAAAEGDKVTLVDNNYMGSTTNCQCLASSSFKSITSTYNVQCTYEYSHETNNATCVM